MLRTFSLESLHRASLLRSFTRRRRPSLLHPPPSAFLSAAHASIVSSVLHCSRDSKPPVLSLVLMDIPDANANNSDCELVSENEVVSKAKQKKSKTEKRWKSK
ncbi:hypothetical protein L1987_38286 [Smallanthus sonchifolius]|uniref:Uncharacterized protein n=1 Tax=Smallanthus sonchifolius TaxID=185202 RepID=A0ACB9HIS1_9ASTR|nr:hypothetical protein L1987_38286 [Smallanthus sonchifolius]